MNIRQIINDYKNVDDESDAKLLDVVEADFFDTFLEDENINSSYFTKVNFKNMRFLNVEASGTYFFNCVFTNVNFEKVNFRKAEFYDCSFLNCMFKDCNISKSEFLNPNFNNSIFDDVNLGWSFFNTAYTEEVSFKKVNFENTMLLDSIIKNSKVSNLIFNEAFPLKYNFGVVSKSIKTETEFLNMFDNY